MSTYEQAPATHLLATQCAACGRPLLDARSVEAGLGPECRKRHGYDARVAQLPEEARARANQLVYRVALEQGGIGVLGATLELRALGFARLADRVLERIDPIRIEQTPDNPLTLDVRAPYSEEAIADWGRVGRWDRERKVRVVAHVRSLELMALLRRHYPGRLAVGRKGPFEIAA